MDAMATGQLKERLYTGWQVASKRIATAPFPVGMLVGVLVASTWFSWTLTWSDDPSLSFAAILMLAFGMAMSRRLSLTQFFGTSELAVAACTWTLMQPWIMAGLAWAIPSLPVVLLTSDGSRLIVGMAFALPCWFVSGWLWSGLITSVIQSDLNHRGDRSTASTEVAFGVASGLTGSVFLIAPWIGAWGTAAIAVATVICYRLIAGYFESSTEGSGSTSNSDRSSTQTGVASVKLDLQTRWVQAVSAAMLGGLFAVVARMMGQLMPQGAYVQFALWIGVATGFAVGQILWKRFAASQVCWGLLASAAASVLLLAIMPVIVGSCLWATAGFTTAVWLMAFRLVLLGMATAPIGLACSSLGWVTRAAATTDASSSAANSNVSSQQESISTSPLAWVSPLAAVGYIGAEYTIRSAGFMETFALLTFGLVAMGLFDLARRSTRAPRWQTLGIGGLSLIGLSTLLWSGNEDPARMSKLLFSTPSFVAHRAGWDSRFLPVLDDARAIYVCEGTRGPITLWRSHGSDLHLRENGIPRAIVSADTKTNPQFAPEVLQAVFPLVMAREPRQVLLLGASGGVPLATCLEFPIEQVVCAESDRQLLQVIRGPMAQETGYDPFADDRVQLTTVPPAMAIMASSNQFDIILSSPPTSSIVAGGALFTAEHYLHASQHLAEGGIFCQRFECIDYGPEPLRIVVKAMRQAFRDVIAIETGAGEFLLMGTNVSEGFIREDLAVRLQSTHVRQLLSRSGLDWSTLLNFPAYDDAALGEICSEVSTWTNTPANGILALRSPAELVRWGPKLQETQRVLTAVRSTVSPFQTEAETAELAASPQSRSRKSRMLEWLGETRVSPDVLHRLSEVVTQMKVVNENPETHWWEYRKALRQQLQKRARSLVQQASHSADNTPLIPEDECRKAYFLALGAAAKQPTPDATHLQAIESCLQPYDPLMSYFARQEIADLQARGQVDVAAELSNRLHVIYFAPAGDASTRNIAAAVELLVRSPDAIPDPARRFDTLNGLVQILRTRWELRQSHPVRSTHRQILDIDRSVIAIERAVQTMDTLYASANLSETDWELRKQVVDRILLRPLRAYRSQLQTSANRTRAAIDAATDDEAPKSVE